MISDQTRKLARFHLDIAHALYQARERAGFSVETLAERSGLTPDRVLRIEEGDTTSLTEVAQFCMAMDIRVADLFFGASDVLQHKGQVTRAAQRTPVPLREKLSAS